MILKKCVIIGGADSEISFENGMPPGFTENLIIRSDHSRETLELFIELMNRIRLTLPPNINPTGCVISKNVLVENTVTVRGTSATNFV